MENINLPILPEGKNKLLHKGVVIPALPLALNKYRKLDERRQRALIRYYLDAGARGIAAAVHTTQFNIRKPGVNLFERLLKITSEEISDFTLRAGKTIIKIAGVIGRTEQAIKEAELAVNSGYDAVLLSLAAFQDDPNKEILRHCRKISEVIPLFGFYLQPAVGGRILDVDFWRSFSAIPNVAAIKIAPFNRYQTYDVIRGVAESGRAEDIALYTGNDDNIVADLLTEYHISVNSGIVKKRIAGGLLGHWAVWTRKAVEILERVHSAQSAEEIKALMSLGTRVTDSNAAFFDVANDFSGVITGIHEVLRRQGLLEGIWTLDKDEKLSPGQKDEINRVYAAYPDLNDDDFVRENLEKWLT
ncbi:MAG: dihydrodipicolinate synthase family protein [Cyclobacteriaceae bacterium]|jgi:dihydrodipicolinate synthase/N-acetylneuraminate lyase